MSTLTRTRPWDTEFAIAAGFAAAVAGSALAAWRFPPDAPGARLIVLAVAVAAGTALTRSARACLPAAVIAWLFCDGFLIDHYGELRWHGWGDAVRLAVLAGAAYGGVVAGRICEAGAGSGRVEAAGEREADGPAG